MNYKLTVQQCYESNVPTAAAAWQRALLKMRTSELSMPSLNAPFAEPVHCAGIGLHSGQKVTFSLKPAPADYGIRFRRADLGGIEIPAHVSHLGGRQQLQTGLVVGEASVETVEHLLAALRSLGIDNVCVELNHPRSADHGRQLGAVGLPDSGRRA